MITALFIFCPVSNMLGKQLTALAIDGITLRIMIESILVRRDVCTNICLNILTAGNTMISLTMFQYHLLIRPTVRTLKREKTAGEEFWKPTRPPGLMLKTVPDQPHIAKNAVYRLPFYSIVLDFG